MEIYGSSNLDSVATEVMELLCVMNLKISDWDWKVEKEIVMELCGPLLFKNTWKILSFFMVGNLI